MRTLWLAAIAGLTLSMGVTAAVAGKREPIARVAPPAPVYRWTGCYVGVGGGYGMYNEQTELVTVRALPGIPSGTTFVGTLTQGGRGWLATAQGGCDRQFSGFLGGDWVAGAFVDVDWTNFKGHHTGGSVNIGLIQGEERLRWEGAVGGRLGLLVRPQFLTFFSLGYAMASFHEVTYVNNIFTPNGVLTGLQLPTRTHQGWFIGAGTEYALSWLPGVFWKNEYRLADYRSRTDTVTCTAITLCGPIGPTAIAERNHPVVQTFRTELVFRFN